VLISHIDSFWFGLVGLLFGSVEKTPANQSMFSRRILGSRTKIVRPPGWPANIDAHRVALSKMMFWLGAVRAAAQHRRYGYCEDDCQPDTPLRRTSKVCAALGTNLFL
jgi:hypothetical protein